MGPKGVPGHQLFGNLPRQGRFDAPGCVDGCQLNDLGLWISGEFGRLAGEIGLLRIGLGADRDVFARGHRHGAGHQSGHAGDQHAAARGLGGGHADHQAGGRDEAVIGPENSGAQPADAGDQMAFGVAFKTAHRRSPERCRRAGDPAWLSGPMGAYVARFRPSEHIGATGRRRHGGRSASSRPRRG